MEDLILNATAAMRTTLSRAGNRSCLANVFREIESLERYASQLPTVRLSRPVSASTIATLSEFYRIVVDSPVEAAIRWQAGGESGSIDLSPGLAIGTENCDIAIPRSCTWVSRRHAVIDMDAEGYTITDTSTNGTYLNGIRLAAKVSTPIKPGDRILLGDLQSDNTTTAVLTIAAEGIAEGESAFDIWIGANDEYPDEADFYANLISAGLSEMGSSEVRVKTVFERSVARIESKIREVQDSLSKEIAQERSAVTRLASKEAGLRGVIRKLDTEIGSFLDQQSSELKEAVSRENDGMYVGTLGQRLAVQVRNLNPALATGKGMYLFGKCLDPIDVSVAYLRDFVGTEVQRWALEKGAKLAHDRQAHVTRLRNEVARIPGASSDWIPQYNSNVGQLATLLAQNGSRPIVDPDYEEVFETNGVGSIAKSSLGVLVTVSMVMLVSSRFFDAELASMRDFLKQRPWIPVTLIGTGLIYHSISYLKKRVRSVKDKISKKIERLLSSESTEASEMLGSLMKEHAADCRAVINGTLSAHIDQLAEGLRSDMQACKDRLKAGEDTLRVLAAFQAPPLGSGRPSTLRSLRPRRTAAA